MGIVGSQLAVVAGEFIPSDSFELLDSQVKSAYSVTYIMFKIFLMLCSVLWNRNRNCRNRNFCLSGTGTGMHSGSGFGSKTGFGPSWLGCAIASLETFFRTS